MFCLCLKPKDDNAIPIPVYWAKVQSLISYMPSLEYSMYDSISGNSIIVMKEHNSKMVFLLMTKYSMCILEIKAATSTQDI